MQDFRKPGGGCGHQRHVNNVIEPPSDADAIRRSLRRPDRFAVLFDRHAATIRTYLARRVGTDHADELTGEVFRVAFEKRDRFRDECGGSARPWLYGIASNLIRRHHRCESRELTALMRVGVPTVESDVGFAEADSRLDDQASWAILAPLIAELAQSDRDILLLVAWEGLSTEGVATALDIPIGTVKSRLHRVRRKLRNQLDRSGHREMTAATSRRIAGGTDV